MKLYQTAIADAKVTWSASATEASKTRTQYKKEGFKNPETTEHDVPTNKVDLLEWLNKNEVIVPT